VGSSLEQTIRTNKPRIINDLEEYLRLHPGSESTSLIVREGMRSSLTCPLIARGQPIGFLFFSSMAPHTYEDIHRGIFLKIASQLSLITEKSRLFDDMVELNAVKNKFLGIAAHDLRNPLIVIEKYLEFLLDGTVGNISEHDREPLHAMQRSCDRMFRLINDLLDVSAIEAGELKLDKRHMSVHDFLVETITMNSFLAEPKNIRLLADFGENTSEAVFDPDRISQVVGNLLSNAIKYSFPGTAVTLSTRRSGDELWVSIADQGQGIPEAELSKLFSDFGRTSVRPTGGESSTGLGLAIAKRIISAHGGRIWVQSTPGNGSTFTFAIPVQD
jgi:signal transduction histidine kinase